MIGSGAFGQVYLGMNLDTGELLAVKQVLGFLRCGIHSVSYGLKCFEAFVKVTFSFVWFQVLIGTTNATREKAQVSSTFQPI